MHCRSPYGWRSDDDARAVFLSTCVVLVHIFDAHMHRVAHHVRRVGYVARRPSIGQDHRAIAKYKLHPMRAYPQAHPEAEGVAQPVARLHHILIAQHGGSPWPMATNDSRSC